MNFVKFAALALILAAGVAPVMAAESTETKDLVAAEAAQETANADVANAEAAADAAVAK